MNQFVQGRKINALAALCGVLALTTVDLPSDEPSFRSTLNGKQKTNRKQRLKASNRSRKRNRRK